MKPLDTISSNIDNNVIIINYGVLYNKIIS